MAWWVECLLGILGVLGVILNSITLWWEKEDEKFKGILSYIASCRLAWAT